MNLLTRPPVASFKFEKALASIRVSLASVRQILASVRDTFASVTLGNAFFDSLALALGNSHC